MLFLFSQRKTVYGKVDDLCAWKNCMHKSQNHAEQLCRKQPDIVAKLNENARIEHEKERLRKEKRD
jgi:hypothetical protein